MYVYEVPPRYNSLLLARRLVHDACALRTYEGKGAQQDAPAWTSNLYGAEVALHEALLASPHRTHAPEEADYFFVPVYVGCFVSEFNRPYPTHWLCDGCHQLSGGARPSEEECHLREPVTHRLPPQGGQGRPRLAARLGVAARFAHLSPSEWHDGTEKCVTCCRQRDLLDWVRGAMPYWNRSSGADHLWPAMHDEGACYSPAELRRATLLAHWLLIISNQF